MNKTMKMMSTWMNKGSQNDVYIINWFMNIKYEKTGWPVRESMLVQPRGHEFIFEMKMRFQFLVAKLKKVFEIELTFDMIISKLITNLIEIFMTRLN